MIITFSAWRGWTDPTFIQRQIDRVLAHHVTFGPLADDVHCRVGDARGGDTIIQEHLAATVGIVSATVYFADWDTYGKPAGAIRNRDMLMGHHPADPMYGQLADLLVAFPEPGRSKPAKGSGTWNAICQAHWRGIEVRIPAYRAEIVPAGADSFDELWAVPQ